MTQEPISVFLAHYDHFLRMNRIGDTEFAQMIGEPKMTIDAVRAGSMPAPLKMAAAIGWERVLVAVPKTIYEDEYRYIKKHE
jgi:hypothetical protein